MIPIPQEGERELLTNIVQTLRQGIKTKEEMISIISGAWYAKIGQLLSKEISRQYSE